MTYRTDDRLAERAYASPRADERDVTVAACGRSAHAEVTVRTSAATDEEKGLQLPHWNMFTARAMTRLKIRIEIIDWMVIVAFAQWDRGIASVGLNATAFV